VVAGPPFVNAARTGSLQIAYDVAVWIKHADFGTATLRSRRWRRASLSNASGRNTDGAE
jgi:hypothetical protein